jgi:alkylation response protein AidB-like acyl-CoA dehydrogenase
MDFELTDEQQIFRKTLRNFVHDRITPVAREWEQAGRYPTEIVDGMRDLGLFGLTVPEAHGGLGADLVSYAIAFEEIARGWMGIAGILGSHTLACWLLAHHGTEAQQRRWLPDLAAGRRRSGIALTEPGTGSDLQAVTTRAVRDGEAYVVSGTKLWITNARHADPLPVLCVTDPAAAPRHRGLSVLMVEAGTPGFTVGRDLGKLGYKGPESCEVHFEAARVPAANLLGGAEGQGFKQVVSALEVGRINVAARSVGVAQASLDAAARYSRERRAFGQPIGDFQAVQLKLADMATGIQAARLLTWWAAARKDRGERTDVETAMAKLFASEVALRAALDSMRVHGSYGYSTEFEVERLYRDAPLMAIGEGTNDILRVLIARAQARAADDR